VKLEEIERQLKDGSLKIRKMTPSERKRFPAPAVARPTRFRGRTAKARGK